jgi:hypothetical protein
LTRSIEESEEVLQKEGNVGEDKPRESVQKKDVQDEDAQEEINLVKEVRS